MKQLSSLIIIIILTSSCDNFEENCGENHVTYNSEIIDIFEKSCNNGGCHPSPTGGGWGVLPDFSSYESMLPYLEGGEIKDRIFTIDSFRIMPPIRFEERQLSNLEKEKLQCWINDNFPRD